ncbi:MAG: aminoacyl-tRNA hydrolase [Bacteroidetes bacterium]|nr:aminoacyl-tRNA hydrolase [Bacteroidota bacterium]
MIGLGNPGPRYVHTRHNIGFLVLDRLADILHVRESSFHVNHHVASTVYHEWRVYLCKPWTWMNNSGEVLPVLLTEHDLRLSDLLVVYDEVQLPLGQIRLRRRGSDGGHNGLASILASAGTQDIARLRCGVDFSLGAPDLAEYVLSPFQEDELPHATSMIERAADAVLAVMDSGFERAMNTYNTPPTTQQE